MSGSALVSTQELSRDLPRWRAFDCRYDLGNPQLGESQYREAHIPGAAFAHLDRDLSGPKTGANGRHPLPEPERFMAWLGAQGLKRSDKAVCYDAGNGTMAARLWWMLRWIGHETVAVLEGGFAQWVAEGRPVTRDVPAFPASVYPGKVLAGYSVDAGFVEQAGQRALLVDARAPARFRGEQEPIDPVAGHIPGAKNRFCTENLTTQGRFKPAEQLRAEFLSLLGTRAPNETIHYCGSGVAACHNLLAMEVAGLSGAKLYAGSWSEWIADSRRPRASGE